MRITLLNCADFYGEGAFKFYSTIAHFFMSRYVADNKRAKFDIEVCIFYKTLLARTDFGQFICTNAIGFASVYDEKPVGAVLSDGVTG